ncbi:unnamed protein product [Urochloa decumbens]|uniref:Uncharacterized protein n=1 Tax=Urochloa decumbens TaxID=240449 RepID=A0ABC8VK17_9POAL
MGTYDPHSEDWLPTGQSASATLEYGDSLRSGSGSNQLEFLSIVYPMLPATRENTPPPASSKPGKEKKAKGKAKTTGKNKKKEVPVPHDSPAMGTRSKTTFHNHSPASHTRSKRKLSLPDLNV